MCSLGRGFLENIPNKPQPLLLNEDPTEAQLPTMRPFSAQAFQACIQANEINGRVSQEENLQGTGSSYLVMPSLLHTEKAIGKRMSDVLDDEKPYQRYNTLITA